MNFKINIIINSNVLVSGSRTKFVTKRALDYLFQSGKQSYVPSIKPKTLQVSVINWLQQPQSECRQAVESYLNYLVRLKPTF